MSDKQALCKLYLELAHVVPDGTYTFREKAMRSAMRKALRHLDFATPRDRNGPVYKAADALRIELGLPPLKVGGRPSEGLGD